MPEEKDLDALATAETALLLAEMEAIIRRARIIVLDGKPLDVVVKEKPEET